MKSIIPTSVFLNIIFMILAAFCYGEETRNDLKPEVLWSSSDTIVFSLDECIKTALHEAFYIKEKEYDLKISNYEIERKKAIWDPVFKVDFDRNESVIPAFSTLPETSTQVTKNTSLQSGMTQNIITGGSYSLNFNSLRNYSNAVYQFINPYYQTNLGLTFRQPLLKNIGLNNGGFEINIARNESQISDLALKDKIESTVSEVSKGYWDFVYAYLKLGIEKKNLSLAAEIKKIDESKLKLGEISQVYMLKIEQKFLKHKNDSLAAEMEYEAAEASLKQLINLPLEDQRWSLKFIPSSDVIRTMSAEYNLSDINDVYKGSIERYADYLIKKKEIENQEIILRKTKNQTLPAVDLVLGGGVNGLSHSYSNSISDFDTGNYYAWEAGVEVSFPWANREARNAYLQAKFLLKKKEAELQNIEIEYFTKLRISMARIQNIQEKISASQQLKETVEKRLDAEQDKLKNGLVSTYDLLDFLYEVKGMEVDAAKDIISNNIEISNFNYLIGTDIKFLERDKDKKYYDQLDYPNL